MDGSLLAHVRNDGQGAENMYDVEGDHRRGSGNPKWEAFEKWCKSMPPKQCDDGYGHKFTLNIVFKFLGPMGV